jgi:hypothetical protein
MITRERVIKANDGGFGRVGIRLAIVIVIAAVSAVKEERRDAKVIKAPRSTNRTRSVRGMRAIKVIEKTTDENISRTIDDWNDGRCRSTFVSAAPSEPYEMFDLHLELMVKVRSQLSLSKHKD